MADSLAVAVAVGGGLAAGAPLSAYPAIQEMASIFLTFRDDRELAGILVAVLEGEEFRTEALMLHPTGFASEVAPKVFGASTEVGSATDA